MLINKQTNKQKCPKSGSQMEMEYFLKIFYVLFSLCVLWITKEDILKNVEDQTVSVPIDFNFIFVQTVNVSEVQKRLFWTPFTSIVQTKKSHFSKYLPIMEVE